MDSLIGPLPTGWCDRLLGEVCGIQAGPSGARLPSKRFTGHGTPVIRPGDITGLRVSDTGLVHAANADARLLTRYQVRDGDLVGTRTGTLGRFALITPAEQGWLFSTQIVRLRPGPEVDPAYLVHYLALEATQEWIGRHASGSTVRSITQRTLHSLPVALPPLELQTSIGEALRALDDKAWLHMEIARTTGELRDALAPLLFSGRMTAPDIGA